MRGQKWLGVAAIGGRARPRMLGIAVALLSLAFLLGGSVTRGAQASAAPAVSRAPVTHTITYDKYSLMIDGKRTFIWSGEFHYWRLPSPSLWLDILEKMKAEGYNAVSIYFDWAYHSPAPGVYDFSGVRDVNLLLDDAAKVGLYVIARPGPYINARDERRRPARLADDPVRQGSHQRPGLRGGGRRLAAPHRRDPRPAPAHQRHRHRDPLPDRERAGEHRQWRVRVHAEPVRQGAERRHHGADFHNDKGRNGIWVPAGSSVPGTVTGPNDLYAFDGYPGAVCATTTRPSPTPLPTGGSGERVAPPAAPARHRTRPDSSPRTAAAGSTSGAARASTTACRRARAPVTSG